jgi:hypothetical protein
MVSFFAGEDASFVSGQVSYVAGGARESQYPGRNSPTQEIVD